MKQKWYDKLARECFIEISSLEGRTVEYGPLI